MTISEFFERLEAALSCTHLELYPYEVSMNEVVLLGDNRVLVFDNIITLWHEDVEPQGYGFPSTYDVAVFAIPSRDGWDHQRIIKRGKILGLTGYYDGRMALSFTVGRYCKVVSH